MILKLEGVKLKDLFEDLYVKGIIEIMIEGVDMVVDDWVE